MGHAGWLSFLRIGTEIAIVSIFLDGKLQIGGWDCNDVAQRLNCDLYVRAGRIDRMTGWNRIKEEFYFLFILFILFILSFLYAKGGQN